MRHILILVILVFVNAYDISLQIQNTKRLIHLYQRKLSMLENMQQQYPYTHHDPTTANANINANANKLYLNFNEEPFVKLNHTFIKGSTFVPPHFIVSNSTIYNIESEQQERGQIQGNIICIDNYHITTIQEKTNKLKIYEFREDSDRVQKTQQKNINQHIDYSKWHRRNQFEDQLMQVQQNTLILINSNKQRRVKLKQQIIDVYTVNQYKILYITRYHYGYINVGSLQILSSYQLPSIAQSTYKNKNTIFVLLKNKILVTIIGQAIVAQQKLNTEIIPQQPQIVFISSFLFIYSSTTPCYSQMLLQYNGTSSMFRYPKRVCLLQESQRNQKNKYNYNFYQHQNDIKLLFSNAGQATLYLILVPSVQKPQMTKYFNFPYQIVIIAIIFLVIIWKKKVKGESPQNKHIQLNSNHNDRQKQRMPKNRGISQIDDYLRKKKKQGKQLKTQ